MGSERAVSLAKIRQIAVPVTDIVEATRFYRDVLGMQHLFDAPPQLSFFDCGGVQLMLSGPEGGGSEADRQQRPIIYYDVADIKATHAALVEGGAPAIQAPHMIARMGTNEIWIGFVGDGQGNMVGLMSHVADA
jgi:methylmalonyl-CoA/ethylmalonyl-CoA epimerase